MMIRNTPNWQTAQEITLNFKKFEMRIVKLFLDALYNCGTEDVDLEDMVKLLALVNEHGSDEEQD